MRMRYKQTVHDGKTWYEHRYVWTQANGAIPKGMHIHHINGNGLDNRLENLILVTPQQNHQKMDRAGKGWLLDKRNPTRPYVAQRTINGVYKYIGAFGTKCGAMMATRMAYVY